MLFLNNIAVNFNVQCGLQNNFMNNVFFLINLPNVQQANLIPGTGCGL